MATKPLADLLAESDNIVRALDAANEVVELMRITHGALHRAHNVTHGEAHEVAVKLSVSVLPGASACTAGPLLFSV